MYLSLLNPQAAIVQVREAQNAQRARDREFIGPRAYPPQLRVFDNSLLLSFILDQVDQVSYTGDSRICLVNKSFAAAVVRRRHQNLSYKKALRMERDSFWHECIMDNVESIWGYARMISDPCNGSQDPATVGEPIDRMHEAVEKLYAKFPRLTMVTITNSETQQWRGPMRSWFWDRAAGEKDLRSVRHVRVSLMDAVDAGEWPTHDLDMKFGDWTISESIYLEVQVHGVTPERAARCLDFLRNGPLFDGRIKTLEIYGLIMTLEDLQQVIDRHYRPLGKARLDLWAHNVSPYTVDQFAAFARESGSTLSGLRLGSESAGPANGLGPHVEGPGISLRDLARIVEVVQDHLTRLSTLSLAICGTDDINIGYLADSQLPLSTRPYRKDGDGLLHVELRLYEDHDVNWEFDVIPVVAIARNLACIIREHAKIQVFEGSYGLRPLPDRVHSEHVSELATYLRRLPAERLEHLRYRSLRDFDVFYGQQVSAGERHQSIRDLAFRDDGRPIPIVTSRAMKGKARIARQYEWTVEDLRARLEMVRSWKEDLAFCDAVLRARGESSEPVIWPFGREELLLDESVGSVTAEVAVQEERLRFVTEQLQAATDELEVARSATTDARAELELVKLETSSLEARLAQLRDELRVFT